MPLLIVTWVFQLLLIVHVLRTGRPYYWVLILLIAPGIGCIAYLLAEVLPDVQGSIAARRAMRNVKRTFNPGADLRQRQLEHQLSGSVDAARHLAAELMENGRYSEAVTHYRKALTGLYENDPDLMLGLATAQFGDGDAEGCRKTLDDLKEHNPEYRSPEGHLLYARALEALDDLDGALEEYEALAGYYPGVEARVRYAQLLERMEKPELAGQEYAQLLAAAELAPKHFRKAQKKWLAEAKEGAARLRASRDAS